jgi:hypothetical protein
MNGTVQNDTAQSTAAFNHVWRDTSTFPLRLHDIKHTENMTFTVRCVKSVDIIYILRHNILREFRHVHKFGTSRKELKCYINPLQLVR